MSVLLSAIKSASALRPGSTPPTITTASPSSDEEEETEAEAGDEEEVGLRTMPRPHLPSLSVCNAARVSVDFSLSAADKAIHPAPCASC